MTYKPDSNLVGGITLPAPGGQSAVSYSYDGFERLTQKKITASANKHLYEDYTYYTYQQGETTRATPLISRVTLRDGANVSTVYDYTYDLLGNITQIKKGGAVVSSYEYDSLGQLVRENDFANTKATLFFYDKAGNMTAKYESPYVTAPTSHIMTMAGSPGDCDLAASYSYSTGAWGDMLTSYNGTTITYDAIGNPKKWRNALGLTWSGKQLTYIAIDGLDEVLVASYNADGIRTGKTYWDENANQTVHNYVLDGSKIVKETVTGSSSYTMYYYYDASGSITGFEYNGTPYYFQKNLQGDIVRILNASGQVVTEYTYDAWGKVLSVTGSLASTVGQINPFRYRGYYYDTETGFYYLQTRYYDPEVGRFINADRIIGANGGIPGYNMFAYCANNPIAYIDPNGLCPHDGKLVLKGVFAGLPEYNPDCEKCKAHGSYSLSKTISLFGWFFEKFFGKNFTFTFEHEYYNCSGQLEYHYRETRELEFGSHTIEVEYEYTTDGYEILSTNLLRHEVEGPFLWSSQIVSANLQPSCFIPKHKVYLEFTFIIVDTFSIGLPFEGLDFLSINLFPHEAKYTLTRSYLLDKGL